MNRDQVRQLLRIGDPSAIRAEASFEGPATPWRGVRLSRVTLVAADATTVPCLFLTPPDDAPWTAGAIAVHQNNGERYWGKSEPAGRAGNPDLAYGLALARSGVATLLPDLTGFEERRGAHPSDAGFEQLEASRLAAAGRTLLGKHVEDIAMATTWLSEHPQLTGGIGIVGHSLGGHVTFFALASDPRLRAGVISCGVGTQAAYDGMNIVHSASWLIPDLVALGDTPSVAAAIRDQDLWVVAGERDPLFPFWSAREVVDAITGGPVDFLPFDGGHGFPVELQRVTLAAMARSLASRM